MIRIIIQVLLIWKRLKRKLIRVGADLKFIWRGILIYYKVIANVLPESIDIYIRNQKGYWTVGVFFPCNRLQPRKSFGSVPFVRLVSLVPINILNFFLFRSIGICFKSTKTGNVSYKSRGSWCVSWDCRVNLDLLSQRVKQYRFCPQITVNYVDFGTSRMLTNVSFNILWLCLLD